MQISKTTLEILKSYASINSNLLIQPGNRITTKSTMETAFAEYECEETFDKQVAIFNLNELLSTVNLFSNPIFNLNDGFMEIVDGKYKIKYTYAEPDLLVYPTKDIKWNDTIIDFKLSEDNLKKINRASITLKLSNIMFLCNGSEDAPDTIMVRVYDPTGSNTNTFDIELDGVSDKSFSIIFKMLNLNLIDGDYTVSLSKKAGKFAHEAVKLNFYAAIEKQSVLP